jgi:hypothetical protein
VPQQLSLLDRLAADPGVWARVDDEHRTLVIETLARLIAKAVGANATEEQGHD